MEEPQHAFCIKIDLQPICEVTNSCDGASFFTQYPEALGTLEFAARAYESFADNLLAIPATPSWTATFVNPDSGSSGFGLSNLTVAEDTVRVYVGGHQLHDNQLALAGPGGPSGFFARGQGDVVSANATDYAMWGGSIAFTTSPPIGSWYFGLAEPAPGQIDFLSVATHELAHIFGFKRGGVPSFFNNISGDQFYGPEAVNLYGGPVLLFSDNGIWEEHWADDTTSPPYTEELETALDRAVVLGSRTLLTPLDYAALKDIGWQVPDQLLDLHGNTDGDAKIDGADFVHWQRGFGSTSVGALQGDSSGDTLVDDLDLWLWEGQFGATRNEVEPAEEIAVPEPAEWTAIFWICLFYDRRSSRCQVIGNGF